MLCEVFCEISVKSHLRFIETKQYKTSKQSKTKHINDIISNITRYIIEYRIDPRSYEHY